MLSGTTQVNPVGRTVPTYRPKNCATGVSPWAIATNGTTSSTTNPRHTPAKAKYQPMAGPPVPARAASTTCHGPAPTGRTRKPLTAKARHSSTRVPSYPTGRSTNGSTRRSRVTSSGSRLTVLVSIMIAPLIG